MFQKAVALYRESTYIALVAAILLSRAAARFEPGSGTPKPHTSTAHHFNMVLDRWSDFSLGKLHSGDLDAVVTAHMPSHFATA